MKLPKAITDVIESFEKLPGIGPKSAQRLTFYLLHVPQGELEKFSASVQNLKKGTLLCSVCFTIDETDPCTICSDTQRDSSTICVVEQTLDVLALEKNGKYKGLYHVLHGRIDPLNNIGPDEIYMRQLFTRVAKPASGIAEIIIATNPTMEGEATAMYINKNLKSQNSEVRITRIGRGLPMGADIEYADDITLQRAMEGRREFNL
ncbi:MAG TPA: recombination mediator RecR [Candidatus Saccharimonadales bacterium]|nr:recombination mediator RecR [Candidatus Saccharimonadales bacterium]